LYFKTNLYVVGETIEPRVNILIDTLFPKVASFSVFEIEEVIKRPYQFIFE